MNQRPINSYLSIMILLYRLSRTMSSLRYGCCFCELWIHCKEVFMQGDLNFHRVLFSLHTDVLTTPPKDSTLLNSHFPCIRNCRGQIKLPGTWPLRESIHWAFWWWSSTLTSWSSNLLHVTQIISSICLAPCQQNDKRNVKNNNFPMTDNIYLLKYYLKF